MALNPRQARFVAEYLTDLNATQAAIRAGYSAHSARQAASVLLANPNIAGAVATAQAEIARKMDITAEQIAKEFASVGFVPMGHKFAKVADKLAALVSLGKHLGMFEDRVRVTASIEVNDARERLESLVSRVTAADEAARAAADGETKH